MVLMPLLSRLLTLLVVLSLFFSSRRRHTRFDCDWSSDVCSSDLDDRAVLHHESERRQALEVVERVAGREEQVGPLAGLDRARVGFEAEQSGAARRPDRKSVV